MNERIEQILSNFDFKKVHEYMLSQDWGWGFENVTPNVERLREQARELLEGVAADERENSSHSCGGFHAHKWTWNSGTEELELIFAIDAWDAE